MSHSFSFENYETHIYGDWQTALMFSIVELDGLLVGSGEIPSVDLEKRAPMRFVIMLMAFGELP